MQKLVRAILPTRRSEGADRLSPPVALAATLLVVALAAACAPASASRGEGETLTVAAAADLQFAFTEIGRLFEEETGARVTFTFGSSGNLARQIENGAPIDLFASADEAYVHGLASTGAVLADSVRLYAIGRIVLASNRESGASVHRLDDLLGPGIARIALANPDHAPYGRAGRQALESAGLWDALQPKIVYGENVRQALQFVQTGNAEAGIIALSIAEVPEIEFVLIDGSLHAPLRQALGVVRGGQEGLATEFAEFVNGPIGTPIMQRYGFLPPGEG
jgi:molybdate transport system substrate-binding protein